MKTDDFVRLYPRLFHMAADGAWPSIKRHGLLSTNAVLTRWEVPEEQRAALAEQVRPSSVVLHHPVHGVATVRDQKPINSTALALALDEMTVVEWLHELNSRVFFFVQPERLATLQNARSYRAQPHVVITVDTARLASAYGDRVQLCSINLGFAQPHSKAQRGRDTFVSIGRYPHPHRDVARSTAKWDVAELCIVGGVADVSKYVVSVDRYLGNQLVEHLE